ncbi:hypothetical protein B0T14DRAFT_407171, partial [Immersiella caudata]
TFDFTRIVESGYWNRLWIVQEVCLARELVLVFGGKMWRFEDVEGWEMLKRLRMAGGEGAKGGMVRVVEARAGRHGEGMRFERLVERFMSTGCQEGRDRVFGLLGLATDMRAATGDEDGDGALEEHLKRLDLMESCGEGEPKRGVGAIHVDYSRSFYDIWADAVKAIFFRARPMSTRFEDPSASVHERAVSIVRTAGVIQAALGDNVEVELESGPSTQLTERPTIQAMGYIAGEITELGPNYSALVGSFRAQQDWLNTCETAYDNPQDLETIRAVNESYSTRILGFGDKELNRIREIRSSGAVAWQGEKACYPSDRDKLKRGYELMWDDTRQRGMKSAAQETPDEQRICIGTERLVALVPPSAAVGDVIVRFWGCDAALVMRP